MQLKHFRDIGGKGAAQCFTKRLFLKQGISQATNGAGVRSRFLQGDSIAPLSSLFLRKSALHDCPRSSERAQFSKLMERRAEIARKGRFYF
jgi:hypothetical protein